MPALRRISADKTSTKPAPAARRLPSNVPDCQNRYLRLREPPNAPIALLMQSPTIRQFLRLSQIPGPLEHIARAQGHPDILSVIPDRATDTCYASNTLLKASPLFGTVIGCFLMKSALATSLV
jgi:hypothetical protein